VVRYPIAVVGSALRGRLDSSTTRIPGLLSIADVAPLARALATGEGGPVSARPDADVATDLRTLDERLTDTHDARAWATPALVGLMLAAIGLAAAVRRPALGRAALLVAPATLTASLALSAFGVVQPTALDLALTTVGAALTVALAGATAGRPLLAAALCGVFVLYLVVLVAWPEVNSLAVIGPHPDGGVRFYGITNEVETLLLVPALAAVSLLGPGWLVPVGLLALATIGLSGTGADGGGAVVFAAAFLTFAVVRLAGRLSPRRLVLVAAAALALALGLVGIDAAAGGSSHATSAVSDGPGALARDAGRRLHLSALQATSSWHAAAIVVGCLAIIAFLVTRRPVPATVQAAVVAVLVSLVVNDSPTDVTSFGALATGALLVWERTRTAGGPA